MRYECIRNCFYDGRYYRKGEGVDFPVGVSVPEHFVCREKQEVKPEKQEEKAEKPKRSKK